MRCHITTLILILTIACCSCKKDLLHWQSVQKLESGTTHRLCNMLFVNDTLGFVTGGERFFDADILTTRDGGKTFTYRTFPEAGKTLFGITKAPNGTLYVIGFDGKLMVSKDNGNTWVYHQVDYCPYKSVAVDKEGHLLIVGGISFDQGYIFRAYEDGGRITWDTTYYELNKVVLLPDGTGFMCGYGIVLHTTDDGKTWQIQSPENDNFSSMDVRSPNEVWMCGYNGSIYHTRSAGRDWDKKRNGNDFTKPRYHLRDILFTDDMNGYAVGENGAVIYTDDGGDHWMEFDRFTTQHLNKITLCPNGSLLVCGDGGALYRVIKK